MEYEVEEGKKKKSKKEKTSKGGGIATFGVIAILVGVILFSVMTIIEKNVVAEVAKSPVVVAVKDVPEGILLTKDNIPNYFAIEMRPTADIPANVYPKANDMIDMITNRDISVKEMVTSNSFKKVDLFEGVDDPVVFSITVSGPGQAVAGTLRSGDLVDIRTTIHIPQTLMDGAEGDYSLDGLDGTYKLDEEGNFVGVGLTEDGAESGAAVIKKEYETSQGGYTAATVGSQDFFDMNNAIWSPSGEYVSIPLMDGVRVYSVYTSAGASTSAVEADGSEQVATIISVVIPRSMQSTFALACADGDVYFAQVIDRTASATKEVPTEKTEAAGEAPTVTVE